MRERIRSYEHVREMTEALADQRFESDPYAMQAERELAPLAMESVMEEAA